MNFKRKETDFMKKQDKQEINNQPVIEDLAVNEAHATEVKGGRRSLGAGDDVYQWDPGDGSDL